MPTGEYNYKNPFKAGDKVRIIGKSIGYSLEESNVYKNWQNKREWFVTRIYGDGSGSNVDNRIVVDNNPNLGGGDFFAPQDLELIEDGYKYKFFYPSIHQRMGNICNSLGHTTKVKDYKSSLTLNWKSGKVENYQPNKLKTMLFKIPNTLKRVLNKELGSLYKVGFINGELGLTDNGRKELIDILFVAYQSELAERANVIIKEVKEDK